MANGPVLLFFFKTALGIKVGGKAETHLCVKDNRKK
jgi:hypothetical protein